MTEAEYEKHQQEEYNHHMQEKYESEVWGNKLILPIAEEMKRCNIKEMHVVMRDGVAKFELIPDEI
jgi:hypothetical protein